MNENTSKTLEADKAWASVVTPFSAQELLEFCENIEQLFRINPYLEFKKWNKIVANHYHTKGLNLSQKPAFEFDLEFTVEKLSNGLRILYIDNLKQSTRLKIEDNEHGSKLVITDDYSALTLVERKKRLGEVDKSLVKWAENIQAFTIMWQRWSWLPPWRWYIRKVWLYLKPIGRRISYMLLWITFLEIILIALGFAIYWVEYS